MPLIAERIAALTGGDGFDLVFDATGSAADTGSTARTGSAASARCTRSARSGNILRQQIANGNRPRRFFERDSLSLALLDDRAKRLGASLSRLDLLVPKHSHDQALEQSLTRAGLAAELADCAFERVVLECRCGTTVVAHEVVVRFEALWEITLLAAVHSAIRDAAGSGRRLRVTEEDIAAVRTDRSRFVTHVEPVLGALPIARVTRAAEARAADSAAAAT